MPCKCKKPVQSYPEVKEWGPVLWAVLHGVAERVGTTPFIGYRADERRALANLFTTIGPMIPCPSCKAHFESYLASNPVKDRIITMPYDDLRLFIRQWFWTLHNNVNVSKGVALFPEADLPGAYGSINIRMPLSQLQAPMMRAIKITGNQFMSYQKFNVAVMSLLSIYGL